MSKVHVHVLSLTLQTSTAVVVFPIPGGPDNKAAL